MGNSCSEPDSKATNLIPHLLRRVVPGLHLHGALLLVEGIIVHVERTCEGEVAPGLPAREPGMAHGDPEVFPRVEHPVRAAAPHTNHSGVASHKTCFTQDSQQIQETIQNYSCSTEVDTFCEVQVPVSNGELRCPQLLGVDHEGLDAAEMSRIPREKLVFPFLCSTNNTGNLPNVK